MLRRDFYSTQFSLCVFWRCVGDALHRINQHCYELLLYATIFFFIFRFTPAPGSGETVVFIVLGKISTFRGFYALNDTFYCFSLRTCCTSTNKWKHKVHHLEYYTFESNKSLHWNDLFWFFGGSPVSLSLSRCLWIGRLVMIVVTVKLATNSLTHPHMPSSECNPMKTSTLIKFM